jgi:hypothetical protein
MSKPKYTEEDMRKLAAESVPGSIPAVFLPGLGYSPKKFKEFLESKGLKEDVRQLFEMPITDVPPLLDDESVSGYFRFRLAVVGK